MKPQYHYRQIWAFPERIKLFEKAGWEFLNLILRSPGYVPNDYPEHMAIMRKQK
jgi:hypothetical protein